ncbi:uncharacterized protein PSFLO_00140 [Pseudozyma flocculosa]|uniref:Uncharacterized protein n=1 Tax=Pseudozyma flocculosa TaxID=84751 RepID=A0A5C3EUB6_9BASI|nr:uncharacterized protein PSFLO_00140 [Pseudozyma flocculosa]
MVPRSLRRWLAVASCSTASLPALRAKSRVPPLSSGLPAFSGNQARRPTSECSTRFPSPSGLNGGPPLRTGSAENLDRPSLLFAITTLLDSNVPSPPLLGCQPRARIRLLPPASSSRQSQPTFAAAIRIPAATISLHSALCFVAAALHLLISHYTT